MSDILIFAALAIPTCTWEQQVTPAFHTYRHTTRRQVTHRRKGPEARASGILRYQNAWNRRIKEDIDHPTRHILVTLYLQKSSSDAASKAGNSI
ncbi:hypothetical protein BDP55DRAFT_315061 [Colletotrichum godetiae]|uniref:Secreted protein n=1 Tax=Colletotrichum godetiae TaxID=1209918 RepID=A0AAJ0AY26_9PEZI|nr:uncharacterized protein BDP55DRAFT_315061 [Colletotrichum godetiae]KAK1690965.1 hypothetical protein BDP55DRAFT_315061 [Colletotrichum godetiae]